MISVLRTFFRLHAMWFILMNAGCFWLLSMSPDNLLVVPVKLLGYGAIYFLSRPFTNRYHVYFNNRGYHNTRLFLSICLCDLLIFLLMFTLFSTVLNAEN